MSNPFPGMNPFLEGQMFPDLHSSLAQAIKAELMPQLTPRYFARTEIYTVTDTEPGLDIGIMYPDVGVFDNSDKNRLKEPVLVYGNRSVLTPPTSIIKSIIPVEVRIPYLVIKTQENNQLITAIEVLSPVNKRGDGLAKYKKKRLKTHAAGVHLLEIDLLRRGTRAITHKEINDAHYLVSLWRGQSNAVDVWSIGVREQLPTIPVPLLDDEFAVLDLQKIYQKTYEINQYNLGLNYRKTPPPPKFNVSDLEWIELQIQNLIKK